QAAPLLAWLKNSLLVGAIGAVAVTLSSSLVAFGFAYFRFRGRDLLFGLVLATMMLPQAVTMIPVYLIWNELGFINTLVPLWAGNLFGSRSEEHTSELQSRENLVCRLLLERKNK